MKLTYFLQMDAIRQSHNSTVLFTFCTDFARKTGQGGEYLHIWQKTECERHNIMPLFSK